MIKKFKIKNRLIATLAAVMLAAIIIAFIPWQGFGSVKAADFDAITVGETYVVNDTLEIPSICVTVDGNKVDCVSQLFFPDGSSTALKNVKLSQAGLYTLEYKAICGGKLYETKKNFTVLRSLFSTEGKNTSAEYVKGRYIDEYGVDVTLTSGSVFKYNKILNLSEATRADNLIKLFFTPQTIGSVDCNKLIITLTDAYNTDNYVTITTKTKIDIPDNLQCMVNASNGQIPTGIEKYSGTSTNIPTITYNGTKYRLHVGNQYGTHADGLVSFNGKPRFGDITSNYLEYKYSYADKSFYNQANMIADLDEPLMFDEMWGGFETGDVYLTIQAYEFESNSMSFFITEIFGEDLSLPSYTDNDAPVLHVDLEDYTETTLPTAVKDLPYSVFKASAQDLLDGETDVNVKVYYDFRSSNRTTVEIKDNAFIPTKTGEYTIEYSSSDLSGNTTRKYLTVNAIASRKELTLSLDGGSGIARSGFAGQSAIAAKGTVKNNIGKASLKIKAIYLSEPYVEYEISDADYEFVPMYAGIYDVTYEYSDYVSKKVFKYNFEAKSSSKPYINAEGVLFPEIMIKNCVYTLPVLDAYQFLDGTPQKTDCEIYVRNDGGSQEIRVENNRFTVEATGSVSIVYRATCNGETTEFVKTIKTIDPKYGEAQMDLSKYFYSDEGVTATKDEKGIIYTATAKTGNTKIKFVNAVIPYNFSVAFNSVTGKCDYEKLNFYILNGTTGKTLFKVTYVIGANETDVYINDGIRGYKLKKGIEAAVEDSFTIGYDYSAKTFALNSNLTVSPKTYYDGTAFNGLVDEELKVALETENVSGNAAIKMISLCNQSFSGVERDTIPPIITINTSPGDKVIGSVAEISPAYSADVLSPEVVFTMSVKDSDGNFAVDTNGLMLREVDPTKTYWVTLSKYGVYTVVYTSIDVSGNEASYRYAINVIDAVAPTVEISEMTDTATLGSVVTVATCSVYDNDTKDLEVYVYVERPDIRIVAVTGDTFTADIKGTYRVYYYVADAFGNTAIAGYAVTVK